MSTSTQTHIAALQDKHRKLDEEILKESAKSAVDHVRLSELKREKLRLKDEIVRLQAEAGEGDEGGDGGG